MIVLDTNVLVRLITKDDIEQCRQAAALLAGAGPFWIGRVVLLEAGWVLRSRYRYSAAEISRALQLVVSLKGTEVEDLDRTEAALRLHAVGMDLGDAFILAFAPEGATVATFDGDLVAKAAVIPSSTAV